MRGPSSLPGLIALGLFYFAAAGGMIAFTRFEGGVAWLWIATAILIAALVRTPRRFWLAPVLVCAIASLLATGLWGLGWSAAPIFALINIAEAVTAAWILRQNRARGQTLGSLGWFGSFLFAVGLCGPLLGAAMAALWFTFAGGDPVSAGVSFLLGHSLGNLAFTPLALLMMGKRACRSTINVLSSKRGDTLLLMPLVAIVSIGTFAQTHLPLLFLPILPIILVTFRIGREGAALAIALLAIIGGVLTVAGLGPTILLASAVGTRILFFQFYLAATVLTVLPVAADLHSRRRINRTLRQSEERFRLLAEHSTDILFHIETDGIVRYVSPSIRQLGGYEQSELIGKSAFLVVAPEHHAIVQEAFREAVAGGGATRHLDYYLLSKNGSKRWFETHARAVVDDDGRVDGVISVVRDIAKRKETERALTAAALTDPLTSLPNRRAFRLAVDKLDSTEVAGDGACLAMFDIDHFKRVNDRFGHDAGDIVLCRFAEIAQSLVRGGDLVARMGGEEFAILFPHTSAEQALVICERLRVEIAATAIIVDGARISVTVSGGVAALGEDGLDRALKIADQALYVAKEQGRDQLALAA